MIGSALICDRCGALQEHDSDEALPPGWEEVPSLPEAWLRGRAPTSGHMCPDCGRNNNAVILTNAIKAFLGKIVEAGELRGMGARPDKKEPS